MRYLRHMDGSSSLLSLQSGWPSHFHEFNMHRPLERHLNSVSGHSNVQFFSSEPSPQSSTPSQMLADGVHLWLSHWNDLSLQALGGHWICVSSVPSAQSFTPLHLWTKSYVEHRLFYLLYFFEVNNYFISL